MCSYRQNGLCSDVAFYFCTVIFFYNERYSQQTKSSCKHFPSSFAWAANSSTKMLFYVTSEREIEIYSMCHSRPLKGNYCATEIPAVILLLWRHKSSTIRTRNRPYTTHTYCTIQHPCHVHWCRTHVLAIDLMNSVMFCLTLSVGKLRSKIASNFQIFKLKKFNPNIYIT